MYVPDRYCSQGKTGPHQHVPGKNLHIHLDLDAHSTLQDDWLNCQELEEKSGGGDLGLIRGSRGLREGR